MTNEQHLAARLIQREKRFKRYRVLALSTDPVRFGSPESKPSSGWAWHATTQPDGSVLVSGALATWFGTEIDPGDDGWTASGVSTLGNPDILGCALPVPLPNFSPTRGTPLPSIPWHTIIAFVNESTGQTISVELIDVGPSRFTNRQADLTPAAFRLLGGNLDAGILPVRYTIPALA